MQHCVNCTKKKKKKKPEKADAGHPKVSRCALSPSLYNNQITDVGARYIARILDECKGLTHLK